MDDRPISLSHRQIEVFRAVMNTGQVTQAAQALHTSQPTVSRELARLEQVLGYALFDRVRGRLQPTARARALLEEVQASYLGLERIAATAQGLRHFSQGRLQLVCLPALAQALVPEALSGFARQQPLARVSLETLESPQLDLHLTEQRVDLGLTEAHEAPPACELVPLLQADEVCVLSASHALAGRSRLTLADFEGQAFVSLAPSDPYRRQIDAAFGAAGVQRQLRVDTPSAASVCALVRQGLGLGIVNPVTALAMAGPDLIVRPLAFAIRFHVALVRPQWRAEHPLRPVLEAALHAAADGLRRRIAAIAPA
ncbi:MAG: HTH-type transcriptional activator CmpR [Pseudomonadota bacterium]|jgi:DNA-binding transcriptional LysR family regulator